MISYSCDVCGEMMFWTDKKILEMVEVPAYCKKHEPKRLDLTYLFGGRGFSQFKKKKNYVHL